MAGFSVVQSPSRWVDTGQGATGRIASWMAWTADPSPLIGPETTRLIRMDDNGVLTGDTPVPLGTGGCGTWAPILDGSSNGATSGGDNAFLGEIPVQEPLVDDFGTRITDDSGATILIGL